MKGCQTIFSSGLPLSPEIFYNVLGVDLGRFETRAMNYQDAYHRKLISAEEAARLVKSGMNVDYGAVAGFPLLIDEKLAERASELERVIIRAYSAPREPQVLKIDPGQEHFIYNSGHFSRAERKYHQMGRCSFISSQLGEMPRIYRELWRDEVDVAFIEVTPMDEQGYFNFGAAISFQKAICDAAGLVVVEVNESQPWVYGGYDEAIHITDVDYIVENNTCQIDEVAVPPPTETDRKIAEHVAGLVEDESTIELGIGVIPNLVGELLIKYGLKDLGIHSGTLTDSMVDLIEAGVVTGRKKSINREKVVHCMGLGSRRLYQYMNRNPGLAGFPSEYTHNIQVIARHKKFIAINGGLKVDLTGQVCSESAGHRQISGTGGQLEYTRGAYLSPGGKAIICLPSTHGNREGKAISNIAITLELGDTVTVPASDVCYIATEFGVVNLKGKSSWQRAKLLISIAHPDFHDELKDAARRTNLIPPGAAKLGYGG